MAERVILDPTEEATGRTELDITPWIASEGVDWGDATIEAYMAQQARGESPVDYRVPNRPISGGLRFTKTVGGTTTVQARANIQAKLARFQQEGGIVKRITASGGTVYADVVNATFNATSVAGWESVASADIDPGFTLEALPDFYGPEVTLSDHTEASACELIFTETAIKGDYPARVRIVVDEDDADTQMGLIWSFRSRHYSSATTAKYAYEAEELQALTPARIVALSGASGGTVVQNGTVSTGWTPVCGGRVGGTAYPTHTGTNRIYARLYSTSGTLAQARLVWDVGDLTNYSENPAWRFPSSSNFYIADLGEVRLDALGVGTHRWDWQIQAKGDVGTEDFKVDRVWIVNEDEGSGVLRAPINTSVSSGGYSARDEFNQSAGNLNGKTAAIGGVWATSGATTDIAVSGSGTATRATTSDGVSARTALLTLASFTKMAASIEFELSTVLTADSVKVSLFAGNATVQVNPGTKAAAVYGEVGGDPGAIAPIAPLAAGVRYRMVAVWMGAWVAGWFGLPGAERFIGVRPATAGSSTVAAFSDWNTAATAVTRTYDNFSAWVPDLDAVIHASQSLQLGTQAIAREDVGGTAYGPVSWVEGDLPRLPPAGFDGRTTQVFLKGSRGDVVSIPDSGIDDISAQVFYRPSWLFVPDA